MAPTEKDIDSASKQDESAACDGVCLNSLVPPESKSSSGSKSASAACAGLPDIRLGRLDTSVRDFKNIADVLFDRIDSDQDGFMDEDELDMALNDPCLTGDNRKTIELLQKHRTNLEEFSNDEWLDEDDGITRDDLQNLGEAGDGYEFAMRLHAFQSQNFAKIDKDNDGFLTRDELRSAIADATTLAEDRTTAQRLLADFSDVENSNNDEWGFENDGITRGDLNDYGLDKLDIDDERSVFSLRMDLSRHYSGK